MNRELEKIYSKFLTNQYSKEELEELLEHFDEFGEDSPLLVQIRQVLTENSSTSEIAQDRVSNILAHTDKEISDWIAIKKAKKIFPWKWTAAAVILIFGLAAWHWNILYVDDLKESKAISNLANFKDEIERPIMLLPDGTNYILKEEEDLVEIGENGCYYGDGTLVADGLIEKSIAIVIPKGKQYKVKLPDGSMVWLNAETTLEYSSAFNEEYRQVTLNGEAYFEIVHDANRLFVVKSDNQEVYVLGTKFGLRSYKEEKVLTTLVEGKVQVNIPNKPGVILNPGEQLVLDRGGIQVNNVHLESFVGWKDGMFIFHNKPLQEVLLELGHWYDLELDYTEFPNNVVYAEIHRDTELSTALKYIEQAAGVQLSLKGRRLVVR